MKENMQRRSQQAKTSADRVTVVCMRWGNPFPTDYVRVLYHGVKRNLSYDFDFVCLSDDLTPICEGVRVLPIPGLKLPKEKWAPNCWPKLTIFKPGLFPPNRPVLFLDLDVVILRSLEPVIELLEQRRGMHILREWNPGVWNYVPLFMRPDRGGQSSMFAFYPGEQVQIYDRFMKEDKAGIFTTAHNDQSFIAKTASNLLYLPHDWAVSFKKHCVHSYPFNLVFKKIKKPWKAKVVVFHGSPKPTDLIRDDQSKWGTDRKFGHGPVDWVKKYWNAGLNRVDRGNRSMKIALLLRRFITTGGAERYAVEVARRLAKKHEVHVFAQEWDHEPADLTLHRVSRPFKKPSFVNQWWFSWRTAKMARGFDVVYTHERVTQFDVMHIHCGTFVGGLRDPARSTRKKSPLQLWLKILTTPAIWAYAWLEKIHFQFQPGRHWIAVSEMTQAEVQRYYDLPDTSFTIAHSGVDQPGANVAERRVVQRHQLGFKDSEMVVLFVGSEFRRKGLEALIAAMGLLKQHGLKLVVVGGGDPAAYKKQAADLGIGESIVWTGLVNNTSDYYAASDVFVLPTLSDACPMSPLEAMAHGCPAILSCAAYAGTAEVIKNDEAVLLQSPKDPAEIANAIQNLLNQDIRKEYAGKGCELAQSMTWDKTAGTIIEALEKCVKKKQAKHE